MNPNALVYTLVLIYNLFPILFTCYIYDALNVKRKLYLFLWYSFGYVISLVVIWIINVFCFYLFQKYIKVVNMYDFVLIVLYGGMMYFPLCFFPFWLYALFKLIREKWSSASAASSSSKELSFLKCRRGYSQLEKHVLQPLAYTNSEFSLWFRCDSMAVPWFLDDPMILYTFAVFEYSLPGLPSFFSILVYVIRLFVLYLPVRRLVAVTLRFWRTWLASSNLARWKREALSL